MEPNHRNNTNSDTYQTGSTRPPRSHHGLFTGILIGAILCISILRAAGLIQLQQWSIFTQNGVDFSQFANLSGTENSLEDLPQPPTVAMNADVSLELEDSPASTDTFLPPGGLPLQDIYEKNIASVVSITCRSKDSTVSATGVVLSQKGYIVTNCHVVEDAEAVQVLLTDGQTLAAAVVGMDAMTDLAVLYVESNQLTPAEFGNSAVLRVGDGVVAIGDPLGTELRGTMTDGIVSAINRKVTTGGRTMTLIQTNAALNSGNSGGPLLNCYGQVIGINTMKLDAAGTEGLGFAIPSTTVKTVVDQLIQRGSVAGRPTLGITGQAVDPFYQIYFHYPDGLYISEVEENSDAEQKGLRNGDILLSLNGQRISSQKQLQQFLYSCKVGDALSAKLYRNGRQISLSLTVEETK